MANGVERQDRDCGIPAVDILGIQVHRVDFAATLDCIAGWIGAASLPTCRQICTVNPEFIVEARRNPAFAAVLQRADLRVPDGTGVLWAAHLLGQPIRERVTGSDGIYRICRRAGREGWTVFLLGGAAGVAQQAAARLQQCYPGLCVVGTFGGNPTDEEWAAIRARLEPVRPDILFVAYGHPRQDLWIDRHRAELPARVAIGVGGAFDFVAGTAVRAPAWMQRLGLEWLHRLIRQPWRWRRMLALPQFVLFVLGQKLGSRTNW